MEFFANAFWRNEKLLTSGGFSATNRLFKPFHLRQENRTGF
jgi:hypothetical protein